MYVVATVRFLSDLLNRPFSMHLCEYRNFATVHIVHIHCHLQMGSTRSKFYAGPPDKSVYLRGAQWLSGRVHDSRPRGRGFESHRRHCVVVLEQDTFILA